MNDELVNKIIGKANRERVVNRYRERIALAVDSALRTYEETSSVKESRHALRETLRQYGVPISVWLLVARIAIEILIAYWQSRRNA